MASVEVRSYTLHTGLLGSLGMEHMVVIRHIGRDADGAETGGTSKVTFADRFEDGAGFGLVANGSSIEGYLPTAAYVAWVDLLRHEDPVFLHWSSDQPGGNDVDATLHLSTGPEPTGEGPTDTTP